MKIGILGGGQLGQMMIYSSQKLPNIEIFILDPLGEKSPAGLFCRQNSITGSFKNKDDVIKLVKHVDILTIENEHVNVEILKDLEKQGFNIQPQPQVVEIIQDKLKQKKYMLQHHIPLVSFCENDEITKMKFPIMLKSRFNSYDGYGNVIINNSELLRNYNLNQYYAEELIEFKCELSVIVVKNENSIKTFPVTETHHHNSICIMTFTPPLNITLEQQEKAQQIAIQVVESLPKSSGIFCVEMFLLNNGEIVFNEIAPRPHNSGHFTNEACETGQFEQHLRAISNLPLGSTKLKVNCCCMINILGKDTMEETMKLFNKGFKIPGASPYWYHKEINKRGRKMGHITIVANNKEELMTRINQFYE